VSGNGSGPASAPAGIDPDAVVRRVPGLFSRRVGSEYLIEGYIDAYSVNDSGEQIWMLCGRGLSSRQIADRISDGSNIAPAAALSDVTAFVRQLRDLGFVELGR